MPQKLGKGGHGQQNYVPAGYGEASGTYGDNPTGSNKFVKFEKPNGEGENQNKPLGVEIKNKEPDKPIEIKPQQEIKGEGKELLKGAIRNKFGKETPNVKILFEKIKNADEKLSGIIGNLYANNPQIELKLGKNLNSKYMEEELYNYYTGETTHRYSVSVGSGVFDDSKNYSDGGVFFHESGHALDHTYRDNEGHKAIWSFDYKSKEFNKSLSEMIKEELGQFDDIGKFKKLKEETQQFENEWETEWNKYEQELKELKEKNWVEFNAVAGDSRVKAYSDKITQLGKELTNLKNEAFDKYIISGDEKEYSSYQTKIDEKKKEILNASQESGDLQRKLYAEKFPQHEKAKNRIDELVDLKYKLKKDYSHKKQVVYGDLSDMIQATTGYDLTGMGHPDNYWDYRGKARGKEAFAEIMSAKATNPDSLKVLQKYIPNSLKIFDEIIGEIEK